MHPLATGTAIEFNIAQGLAVGHGTIVNRLFDDGWIYQVKVTSGDQANEHRNHEGELWVCEFEVCVPTQRSAQGDESGCVDN